MKAHLISIVVVSILVMITAAIMPPTPQSIEYHLFADQRKFFGIPNFLNVISNLSFLLSGCAGILLLLNIFKNQQTFNDSIESLPYLILFFSIATLGFGSAFYHWMPNTENLVWDRLPLAIAFAALLSATIMERIATRIGLLALLPLVIFAIGSVIYWYWTELKGEGNLNFYGVMQFYSIILIIWISLRFTSTYAKANDIFLIIILYGIAKVSETLDWQIFEITGETLSGHTLKHLVAGYAAYRIVVMLRKRGTEFRLQTL